MRLEINRIAATWKEINPVFLDTPSYNCEPLGDALGCRIVLKIETMNPVRCFKGRGVEAVLSSLDGKDWPRSIACASAGNLGQALAYGGRLRGCSVTVFASSIANPSKLAGVRAFGAEVLLIEGAIEDALAAAAHFADRTGAYLLEDSKDIKTCEGAGTIGLELAESHPSLDAVLVSLGAGAMATGIGCVMRSRIPAAEVITVQPKTAPNLTLSIRAGHVVDAGPTMTIADGVAGRYVLPEVLADLREVTTAALLVREDSIKAAMRLLFRHCGLVVEPAAALGVAALLENPDRFRGREVATVICGANVSPCDFERWVFREH